MVPCNLSGITTLIPHNIVPFSEVSSVLLCWNGFISSVTVSVHSPLRMKDRTLLRIGSVLVAFFTLAAVIGRKSIWLILLASERSERDTLRSVQSRIADIYYYHI